MYWLYTVMLCTWLGLAYGYENLPTCNMILAQTIPENLTYVGSVVSIPSISSVLNELVANYQQRLRIGSFYWTMLNNDVISKFYPSSYNGEYLYKLIKNKSKTLPLDIVVNSGNGSNDLSILKESKLVNIYEIDFKKLLNNGIQHSKFLISDNKSFFLGSPNMDWRALSQIKELGVYVKDCPPLAQDLDKFWTILQLSSGPNGSLPKQWPTYLQPKYNLTNPYRAIVNGVPSKIYLATSPSQMNPSYRTNDIAALLDVIDSAEQFICVSVMNFWPTIITYGSGIDKYWPVIRNALIKAALERKVRVQLLISKWQYTSQDMMKYLYSMQMLNKISKLNIEIKMFIIPSFNQEQAQLPYSRVSHSKYMVTDKHSYVGTSNWSGDYFLTVGGVSLVVSDDKPHRSPNRNSTNQKSIIQNLKKVFDDDWFSIYAHDLY